ncbi:uncharacterized protein DSM5745_06305 [Aspergillus mulundensis]|uniref:Xylanolytic transcriptional activator regulatory domain-containing protein n=1 Tax=Aspergillus mulundensis TaxID=1810919 RepID=A0A3D8RQH0_9EURO|nr:Uncharacterized protein DSM5745_06305 [Aspergillus mulundensis]RDW76313.1 Uncharacterized protein DSM5745_06305 [Aspergillus mulundensis]
MASAAEPLPAVKCDRRAPCANCADAGAECRRLRRPRSLRKRSFHSFLGPQESIVDFEGNLSGAQRCSPGTASSARDNSPRPLGNHASNAEGRSPSPAAPSTPSDDGSDYLAIQARKVIQIDLHNPRSVSRERQALLKSALQLVGSIADSEPRHGFPGVEGEFRPSGSPWPVLQAPPRELLFMLLPGPPESMRIQWPDHISDRTYARMAADLLRDQADRANQKFHQFCVCIYVKAIFHLYQIARTVDEGLLRGEMSKSRAAYIAAAMRSIECFNICSPPDLSSIQCLISSALLMQHLGRFNQCWLFVSYAARQITALNYHKIHRLQASSDSKQEIHSAVYWCYYLDRTLSSLLCRPPSLPDFGASPTDLIVLEPSSPYNGLLRVLLDLAQVQSKLHSLSCSCRTESPGQAREICRELESTMRTAILPLLQSNRDLHPKMVQYDWVCVDFCYHAIFVEIHRTRLKSDFSPAIHQECLLFARKSLRAFHFLQQHSAAMPGFDDPTLLLYPLSAFFVVFCNIIATVDQDDYKLMAQIIQRLEPFSQDPHLCKLLNLLQRLQRLCQPLFQQHLPSAVSDDVPTYSDAPATEIASIDPAINPATTGALPSMVGFGDNMGLAQDTAVDNSADWLMWQLFNSQVPAGWFSQEAGSFDV